MVSHRRDTLVSSKVRQSMYFRAFLQASRALLARLYPKMGAKTFVVVKDSLKELVAHVRRSIRRPWIRVDFQTLLFWTPKMTCGCSCSPRRSRGPGRSWTGAFMGIVFLFPFLQVGLLKRITMWDPDGLPATYPFWSSVLPLCVNGRQHICR